MVSLIQRAGLPARTLAFVVLTLSCEKIDVARSNPYDPGNPDYIAPQIIITSGPGEGAVVDTHVVTFQWEGNELVTEYRYNYDNLGWSDWSSQTSVVIDYLDEGDHSFSVQSRYESGDTSEVGTVSYVVDAVKGPALMFYPRRRIVSVGETTSFRIMAEEVTNLTATEFTVEFDPEFIEVVAVTEGSMFQRLGESLFFSELDNASGRVTISMAMLGGENPSADGTGDLAALQVIVNEQGTSTISFDGTEVFRDPENYEIEIRQRVQGEVKAE